MNDIFEKIIAREIPAHIVYEDDAVLAFLDIHPIRKGHTLIVPKKKAVNIFDIDAESIAHMAQVAQKVARAIVAATGATGANLHMNNGHEAGQDVPYAHLHVIPRFVRGEAFVVPEHETYGEGEGVALAEKIKTAVA